MKIVRLHATPAPEHQRTAREVFLNRQIVGCGIAQFTPGVEAHRGEKHLHEDDEVFFVLNGEITVPIIGGPTDVARAGDWILIEAGEEHHLTNHTHLPCTCMWLVLRKAVD